MAKQKHKTEYVQIRVSPTQKARYETAAYAAEKPLSEWMRETLDRAAGVAGHELKVTKGPDGTVFVELVDTDREHSAPDEQADNKAAGNRVSEQHFKKK
jgi:hypothetical protein